MNVFRTFVASTATVLALVGFGAGVASAETGSQDVPNPNRTSLQLPDDGFVNVDLYAGAIAVDGLLPEAGYFDSIFAINAAVVGWFPEEGQGGRDYVYVTPEGDIVTGHSDSKSLFLDTTR